MNDFLSTFAVGAIIFMAISCDNTHQSDNPVSGKWKSLWAGSQNKSLDFNISFESNNTFHIEVFGGQTSKSFWQLQDKPGYYNSIG